MRSAPVLAAVKPAVTFAIVRSTSELAELRDEWDELYLSASPRNAFLSYDWTLACWGGIEQPTTLFVATARVDGRLVGIAPLCISRRLGFRVLSFMAEERSDYLGFLCAVDVPGIEERLLQAVVTFAGEWDIAVLRQLAPPYTELHQTRPAAQFRAQLTRWTSAPFGVWDGDWKGLEKNGPAWFREMRKRRRRFDRDGHRTECFRGVEAANQLNLVAAIEARSWKGRLGTARLQPGRGQDLLRRALETLGARNEMQLWIAYSGDKAIAFQIDFVLPDRLWHYQCAFDEAFAHTRAGSILPYLSLENAWEREVREFDYLAGEEPYKLERTNACRPIYYLALYPRTLRGRLAYLFLLAARWRLRRVPALRALHNVVSNVRGALRARVKSAVATQR